MVTRWRGMLAAALLLVPWTAWAQSSLPFTFHAGATATGNGTLMQADYYSTIHVQIEGTFVGTVVFEGKTKDATAYALVQCTNRTDGSRATEADAPGYWDCPGGAYNFRVRVSAYTSGTIVVTGTGTTAVSSRGSGSGTAQGLDANFDIQPTIDGANSAHPLVVWNGSQGVEILGDPTHGGIVRPKPLGDTPWRIWPNFNGCVIDMEANGGLGANVLCIDPDAASPNAIYQFSAPYKPKVSFMVPLSPRGAATGGYESLVSNQPSEYYLTVTDANTDAADFSFDVTGRMAGATTATMRLIGASKHASPSGNIDLDCALKTYTPGTDTFTAHSTTGEVTALLTPATQNRPVAVTTAAHTINGGPLLAGDVVYGSCEVDATATTSAQLTDFRLRGWVLVTLDANSFSD